jgi:broad specificity phosphatase PhoE
MRALLVRHCHSESNLAVDAGWSPDGGITALGRKQAECLAVWLIRRDPVACLYSSTLRRARETAEILAAAGGIPISLDHRLREVGACWPDGRPVRLEEFPRQFPAGSPSTRPSEPAWGTSESWSQFLHRVRSFSEEMLAAPHDQQVLVVTHSGFIEAFSDLAFGAGTPRRVEIASEHSSITDWEHRPDQPEPWLLHGANLQYHLMAIQDGRSETARS